MVWLLVLMAVLCAWIQVTHLSRCKLQITHTSLFSVIFYLKAPTTNNSQQDLRIVLSNWDIQEFLEKGIVVKFLKCHCLKMIA